MQTNAPTSAAPGSPASQVTLICTSLDFAISLDTAIKNYRIGNGYAVWKHSNVLEVTSIGIPTNLVPAQNAEFLVLPWREIAGQ
jgi:hypothetical protein